MSTGILHCFIKKNNNNKEKPIQTASFGEQLYIPESE